MNKCVCCGIEVPEGRQFCPICEKQSYKKDIRNLDNKLVCCIDLKNVAIEILKGGCKTTLHLKDNKVIVNHIKIRTQDGIK